MQYVAKQGPFCAFVQFNELRIFYISLYVLSDELLLYLVI